MSSTPDTQEKPWLVASVTPQVARGNRTETQTIVANLQNAAAQHPDAQPKLQIEPADIFTSLLTKAAELKHAQISSDAAASILYNDKDRNSLPAQLLKVDMANHVMSHIKKLLNKHHLTPTQAAAEKPQVAVISPQNMTMESLASRKTRDDIALALFLICPDVFGKFDPAKSEINAKIVHLFWNAEAYEKASKTLPPENVKLIIPLDPLEAFPEKPTHPLAEGGKPVIKLSGTGSDPNVITTLTAQLTKIGLAPTVVCEMSQKLAPYTKQNVATESDPGWYYHSLGEANPELPPYLICYPSEQVKHLIVLQQKGIFIPTVFLYPKGVHEVKNLAWAIQQGLSKVICVPKQLPNLENPQAEVAKLLAAEGVEPTQYVMVDPSELTKEHFQKPTRAWERPPAAQSLFDTVRNVLAGTQAVVKAN